VLATGAGVTGKAGNRDELMRSMYGWYTTDTVAGSLSQNINTWATNAYSNTPCRWDKPPNPGATDPAAITNSGYFYLGADMTASAVTTVLEKATTTGTFRDYWMARKKAAAAKAALQPCYESAGCAPSYATNALSEWQTAYKNFYDVYHWWSYLYSNICNKTNSGFMTGTQKCATWFNGNLADGTVVDAN